MGVMESFAPRLGEISVCNDQLLSVYYMAIGVVLNYIPTIYTVT